ncbi:hypothetical protein IW261DRAFT_1422965 [Armillaria novae-zelandiae]|uniref:Uncharacterized protein n=1 Tax=Armillaria novae-zelandiae TaxID=153914 RepID=A0AA39NYT6_9AGAR|nr:hypothetical protein IW261DRAFT_1422965 [Armillaria novae-zelandiae]
MYTDMGKWLAAVTWEGTGWNDYLVLVLITFVCTGGSTRRHSSTRSRLFGMEEGTLVEERTEQHRQMPWGKESGLCWVQHQRTLSIRGQGSNFDDTETMARGITESDSMATMANVVLSKAETKEEMRGREAA